MEKELKDAADCYGRGDYRAAYERYRLLAEAGHAESQVFVGWMLFNGIGTEHSHEGASYWFQRAASLGSPRGAFYYGRFLTSQGEHVDALEWYRIAANKHDTPALFRLGYSLARGKGAAIDLDAGYRYLIAASKNGHVFAIREIAIQDAKGGRGMVRRMISPFVYAYAVSLGLLLALRDRFSERLLA
ncbi:sel1 repeat family protein [Ectothiorhodospiraceae bacterium 2226]|nr:sel1 repeat family protein [Ectothiorhodospiraceae bacterium 2226]